MDWNFRSDQPIYAQLVEQITLAILSGVFAPGSRLPAVRELAAQAGVNPNTMQRAMAELEQSGLIYSQRTSGRFVAEDGFVIDEARYRLARQRTKDYCAGMAALGYDTEQILKFINEEKEEKV
ncbi:MAG: GntR family transcriptional regulator [Oscillospiraceae bacterium]|nr:GntR family transcriptional regulator [Oscillospiraceae bacterium]